MGFETEGRTFKLCLFAAVIKKNLTSNSDNEKATRMQLVHAE